MQVQQLIVKVVGGGGGDRGTIGVNLYTFGVALGPPPPMLSLVPAMVVSAPAIIEGCQSMKWAGSIRWINNPVQSLELTDFTGFVT